jgi:hypothetical protein
MVFILLHVVIPLNGTSEQGQLLSRQLRLMALVYETFYTALSLGENAIVLR